MNRTSRLTVVFLILYTAPCLSFGLFVLSISNSCHKMVLGLCVMRSIVVVHVYAIVSEVPLMYGI